MIGVVGGSDDLLDALSERQVRAGSAEEVVGAAPDAVVAVGESAAIDLARAGVDAPVLPVDAGPALGSIPPEDAVDALERVLSGEHGVRSHPVLAVRLGEERAGRALFDAMLVTSEPGRISEYAVAADGSIDRFRADGVVVATPAGSRGYANAAGGPIVDARADALAVVPVSAFRTRSAAWVLDPPVTLSIAREENDISLLLDDRERPAVPTDRPVRVDVDGEMAVVTPG